MTDSEESKLDELLQTAKDAKKALNHRTYAFLFILVLFLIVSVIQFRQGNDLKDIAETNRLNGQIVADNSGLIIAATGADAQARSRASFNAAINEVRRSIDCTALYLNDERYPACKEVSARLDSIRAGGDPFTTTTTVAR